MTKIFLVRHGISEYNSVRRFAGHTDVELTSTGYGQAERLRDRLAGEKIDIIFCSDLKRAMITAKTIASCQGAEITICPELREINYGVAEGLSYDEISRRYPETAQQIKVRHPDLKFPEGESINELIEREDKFLERLKKVNLPTVLIVAHSGPLQMLVCRLAGIPFEHWWQFRIDNASLSIIDTYPQGAIISLLNDVSHLKNGD